MTIARSQTVVDQQTKVQAYMTDIDQVTGIRQCAQAPYIRSMYEGIMQPLTSLYIYHKALLLCSQKQCAVVFVHKNNVLKTLQQHKAECECISSCNWIFVDSLQYYVIRRECICEWQCRTCGILQCWLATTVEQDHADHTAAQQPVPASAAHLNSQYLQGGEVCKHVWR